jgi:hypothetical protein
METDQKMLEKPDETGLNFDYENVQQRMNKLKEKMSRNKNGLDGELNPEKKGKRHTLRNLLLAATIVGTSIVAGAYNADVVKSVTEPVNQKVVRPMVDAASDLYNRVASNAEYNSR